MWRYHQRFSVGVSRTRVIGAHGNKRGRARLWFTHRKCCSRMTIPCFTSDKSIKGGDGALVDSVCDGTKAIMVGNPKFRNVVIDTCWSLEHSRRSPGICGTFQLSLRLTISLFRHGCWFETSWRSAYVLSITPEVARSTPASPCLGVSCSPKTCTSAVCGMRCSRFQLTYSRNKKRALVVAREEILRSTGTTLVLSDYEYR